MVITVSISELRNNISLYIERAAKGAQVFIRDEKKNKTVAQIIGTFSFDKVAFEQSLRKAAGVITSENHPEWKTKTQVIKWVNKNRLKNQRAF